MQHLLKVVKFNKLLRDHFYAICAKNKEAYVDHCEMCNIFCELSCQRFDTSFVNYVCFECYLKPDLRLFLGRYVNDGQILSLEFSFKWNYQCSICEKNNTTKYCIDGTDNSKRLLCADCVRTNLI
jgi:hypothetical protein